MHSLWILFLPVFGSLVFSVGVTAPFVKAMAIVGGWSAYRQFILARFFVQKRIFDT